MIKYEFVERLVEQMNQKYFLTEVHSDADKIHEIMMGFLAVSYTHLRTEEGLPAVPTIWGQTLDFYWALL